ncbi:hypothetical protein HZS_3673, partial [Henneguya salminicola]
DPEPEKEPIPTDSTVVSYLSSQILWNLFSAGVKYFSSLKQLVFPENDRIGDSEDQFLRCLTNKYYRYYVDAKPDCKIWTLSSVPPPESNEDKKFSIDKLPVVLIHGLLSGLAYWAMNLDTIVNSGHAVFAIDLPGFARSSRIEFSEDPDETEKIFVELIECWRIAVGIERMIIIGHSFGGYITVVYSLSYPHHVAHDVLIDPWGFPDVREEVTAVLESGDRSSLSTPLTSLPIWVRILVMVFMPFSPFTFLRLSGKYFGPKIIHLLRPDMTRRYACIFGDNDDLTVPNYIYHTNKLSPTGENAFRSMAMPLAWAKNPLIKRISQLNKSVSVSFVYGSRSWIDFQTGFEVKNILKESIVNVYVIDGAGHHLFADEPEIFNSLICKIIKGSSCDSHSHQ